MVAGMRYFVIARPTEFLPLIVPLSIFILWMTGNR